MKKIFLSSILTLCFFISAFGQNNLTLSEKEEVLQIVVNTVQEQFKFPSEVGDGMLIKGVKADGLTLIFEYQLLKEDSENFTGFKENLARNMKLSIAHNLNDDSRVFLTSTGISLAGVIYDHNGNELQRVTFTPDEIAQIDNIPTEQFLQEIIKSEFTSLPIKYDDVTITKVWAEGSTLHVETELNYDLSIGENEYFKEMIRQSVVSEFGSLICYSMGKKGINIVYDIKDVSGKRIPIDIPAQYLLEFDSKKVSEVELVADAIRKEQNLPSTDQETGIITDVSTENENLVFLFSSQNKETDFLLSISFSREVLLESMGDDIKDMTEMFPVTFRYISSDGSIINEFIFTKADF